jgi:hypothetical protein
VAVVSAARLLRRACEVERSGTTTRPGQIRGANRAIGSEHRQLVVCAAELVRQSADALDALGLCSLCQGEHMADLSDLRLGGDLVGVEQPEAGAGDEYGETGDDICTDQSPVGLLAVVDDVSGRSILRLGGVVRLRLVHDTSPFPNSSRKRSAAEAISLRAF